MRLVLLSKEARPQFVADLEKHGDRVVRIANINERMRYNDVAACYVPKGEYSYWRVYLAQRVFGRGISVVWF